MVAVRVLVLRFSPAVKVKEPVAPVPEAPVSTSQPWLLPADQLHEPPPVVTVTETGDVVPAAGMVVLAAPAVNTSQDAPPLPVCVIAKVARASPLPTVIEPLRELEPAFAETVTLIAPFPVKESPLLIVIHESLGSAYHAQVAPFVETATSKDSPPAGTALLVGVKVTGLWHSTAGPAWRIECVATTVPPTSTEIVAVRSIAKRLISAE